MVRQNRGHADLRLTRDPVLPTRHSVPEVLAPAFAADGEVRAILTLKSVKMSNDGGRTVLPGAESHIELHCRTLGAIAAAVGLDIG